MAVFVQVFDCVIYNDNVVNVSPKKEKKKKRSKHPKCFSAQSKLVLEF